MNWGKGLALALGIFALGMGFTVYKVITLQGHDLVTEDYYAQEIAFQDKIDQTKRGLMLEDKAQLHLSDGQLVLHLPDDLEGLPATAEIYMYCLTDASKDFSTSYTGEVKDLPLPAEKLSTGKWTAKVHVSCNHTTYYFEPEINLP